MSKVERLMSSWDQIPFLKKSAITALSYLFRYASVMKQYYTFGMWQSKRTAKKLDAVKKYGSVEDITADGQKLVYAMDPPHFDHIQHPRVLQAFINDPTLGGGDCDDSAAWWCAALKKSGLAKNVWLSAAQGFWTDGAKRAVMGHAVCVFETDEGFFWTGNWFQNVPRKIETRQDWPKDMDANSGSYKSESVKAFFLEVKGLDRDDALEFGKVEVF